MDCIIRVAKTKALISFAYAKSRFSLNEAQVIVSKSSFFFSLVRRPSLIPYLFHTVV